MQPFPGHCYHFASLDSTQRYLLDHAPCALPVLCTAAQQSAGVGQRGRHWQSPPGQLYFSLMWRLPGDAALHQGIAQMIALVLAETIDPTAKMLRLKWPNDLYLGGYKCGGILIDTLPDKENTFVIVGIGINLTRSAEHPADIACLNEHFADETPQSLLDRLLPELCRCLAAWAEKPYLPLTHRWNAYDLCQGQSVRLEAQDGTFTLHGIDQKGRLIAKDNSGKPHFLSNTRILWPIS